MIVQQEVTEGKVYDIVNELLGAQDIEQIQQDIADLQTTQTDHETRLDVLEAQNYPELLRNLQDVNMTPTVAENGHVVKYDNVTDKFILSPESPGVLQFNLLQDVDVSTRINDDIVLYDSVQSKWVNSDRFKTNELNTLQNSTDIGLLDI